LNLAVLYHEVSNSPNFRASGRIKCACRTAFNGALRISDPATAYNPDASTAHQVEHLSAVTASSSFSRLSVRWLRLSGNFRGILWLSLGTILFAATDVVVKTLGQTLHPFELALFRYVIGFAMLAPVFLHMGWARIKTQRIGLHLTRLLIACTAQIGIFVSVIHLKLADATAIMFSKPLFTTIIAVILLSEIVRAQRWAATAIGFVGVIIMVRPGAATMDPIALIAVGAALTLAAANVIIRIMSKTEPPNRILFYYHVGGIVIFLGPAIWVWQMPVGIEWVLLCLIGFLTTLGMICYVRAFSAGEANAVGPIEYVRLIYAGLFGYFLFSEIPDFWTVLGGVIIVASSLYIAKDEARRPRQVAGD
jgi:drug/metabolite transporter (DMT)-like permease